MCQWSPLEPEGVGTVAAMTGDGARVRVPQAQRSAATRSRLLDAAVACLSELGYAGTSTQEVGRRAGVSRGAQLHHYPTKDHLLAAAVEHTMNQRLEQFRQAMASAPADTDRIETAIDVLWAMFTGPACDAWVELAVAARTQPGLRPHVDAVSARHRAAVEDAFHALLPRPEDDPRFYDVGPKFLLALFDGLALHAMSGYDDEPGRADAVVAAVKQLAKMALPGP